MPDSFVLVHAPALGPAAWQACAEVLRSAGASVAAPDLRGCMERGDGWWRRVAEVCTPLVEPGTVVVGHSGSGVVLPLVSRFASTVVFVDAIVPVSHGATVPSEQIRSFTASLAADGRLPRWSEWFDAEDVAGQVTDSQHWQSIVESQPCLPADFYDYAVPVPDDWERDVTCRYLQFSDAYDDHAAEAARRGWPVTSLPGTHLHQADRPEQTAQWLLEPAA